MARALSAYQTVKAEVSENSRRSSLKRLYNQRSRTCFSNTPRLISKWLLERQAYACFRQ
jgi:hypothetical protein